MANHDSSTVPKFPVIPPDAAKDFQGKVVIVGAGVAGLFAANTLKFLGVEDFVVLEAGDTFGGRLKSAVGFHEEVPLELGAEWIHASNGDVVRDMLVFPAEEGLEPSEFIKYQPQWFFGSRRSRVLGCVYQETKWKRTTWLQWLERYVYRHVQEKVQFNAAVKEVAYGEGDGDVRLLLENGTELRAAKVICTMPLSVLKLETVKFAPPLPEPKRQAIDSICMLPGFRVLFEMKEKFYPDVTADMGMFELMRDHDQLCFAYDALYGKELSDKQNVLAVVAIGDKYCKDLKHLDDESLANAALGIVDRLFNGQGTANYIKHRVQNWNREPHILGAYSLGGASHEREELGKTVNGRVLFAGEHTSLNYYSLVPGAALEGRRAAVEAVSGRIMS
jgi:monoamine oxidase